MHPVMLIMPQAFVQLALRLLLHQLQEHPTAVGCSTPAAVLVPALGQMLAYSSANIQVGVGLLMLQGPSARLTAVLTVCCCFTGVASAFFYIFARAWVH